MRKVSIIVLAFAAMFAPSLLRADDIVYSVNQTEGSFNVTGTVTTDGTIGTLSTADIVSWGLTLNASPAIVLNPGSSTVVVIGGALSASATQLIFNFTSGSNDNLQFNDSASSSWWHVVSQPPSAGYNEIAELSGLGGAQYNFNSGNQVIAYNGVAVPTPEPGTSSMMLIGLGLLGWVILKKKRSAVALPQIS